MPKSRLRTIRRLAILATLTTLVFWLAASTWAAWWATRRDKPPFAEPPSTKMAAPVAEVRLDTSDGEHLGGWLVRGRPDRGGVVLLHGIQASRSAMRQVMQWLAEDGYTALAISLRGHGDSTGDRCDFGWSSQLDVVAAIERLERECPGRPIYVVGHSMGAAAAIYASRELGDRVAGYFLAQPYMDLSSAAWTRLRHALGFPMDWVAYGGLRVCGPLFLPVRPGRMSPRNRITDIPESVPIVIAVGSADPYTSVDEVTDLYRRVQSHAKLVIFEGATHIGLEGHSPQLYRRALFELLHKKPVR